MTPEARAARERKQKIFVVVGGLLLLGLLAFQLPKLLGGSSGDATAATTTTTAGAPATPGVTPPASTPAPGGTPVAATAKLTTFTVFERKDPFVQQVATVPPAATAASAPAGAGKTGKGEGVTTTKFSTGAKGASATIVTVNGERQVLEPGTKFPSSDPLFVLVAENPGKKSVVVGIAGGSYSGGRKTTVLRVGKTLSLVNTATGARYKITLVSVGSGGDTGGEKPSQEQP
jgi:hypothetical protein